VSSPLPGVERVFGTVVHRWRTCPDDVAGSVLDRMGVAGTSGRIRTLLLT
jgi:hypothetical protein